MIWHVFRRMDPNTSASGGAPLQNTSPIMDPAELRDIIVRQGASIRSYQEQMESLQDQLRSASLDAPRDPPTARGGKDISIQLMELRQGSDAAADYPIRFRTLAAQSGWNDASLWAVFRAGLKPELQAELACHTEDTTLSQFVATAIRLDNLLRQHQAGPSRFSSSFREEVPEPMQLGGGFTLFRYLSLKPWRSTLRPPWQRVTFGRPHRRQRQDSFFVGKKDGGLRPCIDYRGLNAITVPYPYPLPLVPAALEQLRGARIFSKLDLRSAYNLVRIKKGDEWKTAFHTTHRHYEYRVMPFGLTNAPAVFQALINGVFQDLLGKWVIAYIDDILVYSASLEEHVLHVREVLSRLQQHHLYVKLEKCKFHQSTVTFLGYVVSRRGVEMDEAKVWAVTDWSAPTTVRELQRFLGFANFYRRFIRNYSSQLKDCFTSAPILRHPDPDLPFVVEVDASSSGLGAVLSQRHGEPGKLYPCAFYSRKLTTAKANYDVGNRELLAIKAALEEWRHWLEGARHPFQVLTDHRNLEYLRGAKRLNPRQARWALFFTRFRFMVTYRPGSKNGKADALSRRFEGADEPVLSEPILPGPPPFWPRYAGTLWRRFSGLTLRSRHLLGARRLRSSCPRSFVPK
ncbi:hypothetical protein QTP86_025890 [Hemibagrus guttatus]|nr:hypothetical protein QTP86_025890 [Hemibagrus guttatus]